MAYGLVRTLTGNEQKCSVSASKYSLRGGSWVYIPWYVRSAFRYGFGPGDRTDYLGFRLAQDN